LSFNFGSGPLMDLTLFFSLFIQQRQRDPSGRGRDAVVCRDSSLSPAASAESFFFRQSQSAGCNFLCSALPVAGGRLNSLTPNKKLSLGRLLASYTQAHKHPQHDGAVSPSISMGLMDEHTAPLGASLQGVGRGHRRRVLSESIN
jgi:hypothetical protein